MLLPPYSTPPTSLRPWGCAGRAVLSGRRGGIGRREACGNANTSAKGGLLCSGTTDLMPATGLELCYLQTPELRMAAMGSEGTRHVRWSGAGLFPSKRAATLLRQDAALSGHGVQAGRRDLPAWRGSMRVPPRGGPPLRAPLSPVATARPCLEKRFQKSIQHAEEEKQATWHMRCVLQAPTA